MTTVDAFNVCNYSTIAPHGNPATRLDRTSVRLQAVPDRDVPGARDRAPDRVPHLPAGPRLLARAAAQQSLPAQEPVARHRAVALDRPDGAVSAGVLVDLRSAVLDHFLSSGRRAAHPHHLHRFPRHALAGAVLADRSQHLARYPL